MIRVAGNTVDESTMASLEYAVEHLKVKVLMVRSVLERLETLMILE